MRKRGVQMKVNKRLRMAMCIVTIPMALFGCSFGQEKENQMIVTEDEEEKVTYNLGVASKQDVALTAVLRLSYKTTQSVEQCFPVGGRQVSRVYVQIGDKVEKGQMLAELSTGNIEEQQTELAYQIERTELLLQQTKEDLAYELSVEDLSYSYSRKWLEDQEAHEKAVAEINQNYQYTIEDYEDTLTALYMREDEYEKTLKDGYLYADISGTVSYIKTHLEGSTSKTEEVVFRIEDGAQCTFISDKVEYKPYFQEGVPVDMRINVNGVLDYYSVYIYQPEKEDSIQFVLDEQYSGMTLSIGTNGSIVIPLDYREHALCVPNSAMHQADDKYYVYMLDENGYREVRWVEPGLSGDEYTEILSGLEEGDKVILK